jgi:hypothetical protein
MLELDALSPPITIHYCQVIEPIPGEKLLVTVSINNIPKKNVHKATCNKEILIFVATMSWS